jgi:hypothetical protein
MISFKAQSKQRAWIDDHAERLGLTRSAFLRELVVAAMEAEDQGQLQFSEPVEQTNVRFGSEDGDTDD